MSKSLTLSMSLALALGFTGVSFAGHKGCENCGLTSPQGVVASPQGSPQYETGGCYEAPKKKKCFLDCLKPKPKMYTYEWVLKKKKVHGHQEAPCESCGTVVTPTAQYASPQGVHPAPQGIYPAPQGTYAAHQGWSGAPSGMMTPPAEMKPPVPPASSDMVPPAPTTPPTTPPAPPAPPTPPGAQSSLLNLSPAGE